MSLECSDCDEPFLQKFSESGKIIGLDADNRRAALAWDGDKINIACASGEREHGSSEGHEMLKRYANTIR